MVASITKRGLAIVTAVAIAISAFIVLFQPQHANANSEPINWSWTESTPTIAVSTPSNLTSNGLCPTPRKTIQIAGEFGTRDACIYGNGKVNFAVYFAQGSIATAISFGLDNKMYKLYANCDRYDSCLYVPEKDMLITKQHILNRYVYGLVIYKNFTNRLSRQISGLHSEYTMNTSNADYILANSNGYAWPINGLGISDNGNWLAIELRQHAFGLMNLNSMELKRISTQKLSYGVGSDSSPEIDVSNDGRQIAIMGANSPTIVYEITDSCGDSITESTLYLDDPIVVKCKEAKIDFSEIIYRYMWGYLPSFNSSGNELRFYAQSYTGESREVVLRASGYNPNSLDYLALGDSFTSGEGETSDDYYLPGTNELYEKCHVSSRSYPYLVSELQNIEPGFAKSVACSGATMEDIINSGSNYYGQYDRLVKMGFDPSSNELSLARTIAKEQFIPGRIHQETFVEYYKPNLLTVSIGGNDAGFMEKLTDCVSLGTCDWVKDRRSREQTAFEIKALFPKLVDMFNQLHADSPKTKIYAVGYPLIIDPDGECPATLKLMFNREERQFMNEGIKYLNQVIKAAAQSTGIGYIDIEDSFQDNLLCSDSDSPAAMNTIRFGDDTKKMWVIGIGNESFHPTPYGHSLTAAIVNSATSESYCSGYMTICPDSNITIPEPPDYWIDESPHDNYPIRKRQDFLANTNIDSVKHIEIAKYSLSPDSEVIVEIQSDPIELGRFIADETGALRADITLSDDLEYDIHSIHIYGTSYSGEVIELYQFINHIEPHEENNTEPDPASEGTTTPSENTEIDTPNTEEQNSETKTEDTASDKAGNLNAISNQSEYAAENNSSDRAVALNNNSIIDKPEVKGISITKETADPIDKTATIQANINKEDNNQLIYYATGLLFTLLVLIVVIKTLAKRI